MIFWGKRVCHLSKRTLSLCIFLPEQSWSLFNFICSELLFSLIGSASQNHTSTPTVKLLSWHLCYEVFLPTPSVHSQAFYLSVSPSDFNFVEKFPPKFRQVKATSYQVIHHLVTPPWSAELKTCHVQWHSAFTGSHSRLLELYCYTYTRCKNFSYYKPWISF